MWIDEVERLHQALQTHRDAALRGAFEHEFAEQAIGAEYIAHSLGGDPAAAVRRHRSAVDASQSGTALVNTIVKRLSATGQERDRLCGTNWLAIRTLTIDTVPVQMPSPHPLVPPATRFTARNS